MTITPAVLDLSCQDNEDWSTAGGWGLFDAFDEPIDLTGVTFAMQVRPVQGATGAPLLSWTGSGDATGLFHPFIPKGPIAIHAAGQSVRRLAYDLTLTKGGVTTVYVRGAFTIEPGVTR